MKQPAGRLAAWLTPTMLGLCVAGGALCRYLHASTALATAGLTLMAMLLYIRTTQISFGNPERSRCPSARYSHA
ncbi:MAG: hypothetical protein ACLUI3_08175 [Christensenellales bacterium]